MFSIRSVLQTIPVTVAGILLALVLSTSTASAEGGCTKYAAVYWSHQTVGGEFDGTRVLSSVNGDFAVPNVNGGHGFGLALGARTRWVGIELGYRQSDHDLSWMDQTADGRHEVLSADGRFFPVELGRLRPFVTTGVFMEWLTADNAYCSTYLTGTCRERFNGFGLSFGGGLDFQLTGRLFVTGQAQYRHSQYDSIKSLDIEEGTLSYTLDGGGWSIRTGFGLDF